MPTSFIGRISHWGLGVACMIGLAACGAAESPAAAPSRPTTLQAATLSAEPPITEPATPIAASATPTAIPTVLATQPQPAMLQETTMPDQKSPEPTRPGRATLQPAITLVPEGAAPSNPPIATTPDSASAQPPQVEVAKADLARRRAVASDTIRVVEVRAVTWPNPGLGCPQPGMAYKQVPVDGLLIRLESGGQVFEYHSGGSKAPFLCEQPPQT